MHRSHRDARLNRPADVCERYGIVWVALEPARVPIPTWPDGDDDGLGEFSPTAHISEVLAAYQTDNLLDASHFPFLHNSLSTRNPLIGDQEVVDQHDFGFSTVQRKLADDNVSTEGWLRYTLVAPFTVMLRSEEPDGRLRNSFFQAIQPIDDRLTRLFFHVRVPETEPSVLAELLADEEVVQQEDLWITAALRRQGMPLGAGTDLHVRSDANAILYRRVLRHVFSASSRRERRVSRTTQPWFVGAWRRRSIVVPGGQPTEPCEAWWIQSADAFVDVRVAAPGMEHNGLPYSSTRAFAGRFEIAEGEVSLARRTGLRRRRAAHRSRCGCMGCSSPPTIRC